MISEHEVLLRNYVAERAKQRPLPEKILIWDETLRDGEQMPGVVFSTEEKLEIARLLDEVGVHIADCGIPVVSRRELESIQALAREGLDMSIMCAARTIRGDVDACVESEADEISIFVACSDLHLKYKLRMSREQVLEATVSCVEYAREHGFRGISFVTEDTVRADMDYVVELYGAASDAGATRLVFCDTVGVMTPSAMGWWIDEVRSRLGRDIQMSIHCHNDFGMAVANEIAAVEHGVEVPHCCVNGIGERAGNAALEDLVCSLGFLYGKDMGLNCERLYALSRRVEEISGVPVAVNKPIVGYNAFAHESGIHTHGVLKHTLTYEPIQPGSVGQTRRFIYGKHTGTASIADRVAREGFDLSKEDIAALTLKVKGLAESRGKKEVREFIDTYRRYQEEKKGVSDEELLAMAREMAGK